MIERKFSFSHFCIFFSMIAFILLGVSLIGPTNAYAVQCGDGYWDEPAGEECDDGNTIDGDGCSSTCKIEPYCGDGTVDAGEECDDGNNTDGDGCSAACTTEPVCGDGTLDPGEGCDDGNNIDGDGCSANCTIEPICGNGVIDYGEECDDGNNIDGDGCASDCTVEPYCGDGYLDPGEQCDDGNNVDGDGCASDCTIEGGGDGCTPGYWKQTQHFDSWTAPYTPDTLFSDVFDDAFPNKTLLDVLKEGGGGLKALGRHTVAALLNAASPRVSYDETKQGVIDIFNAVFPGGDYEDLKNYFEGFNEQGCPLN